MGLDSDRSKRPRPQPQLVASRVEDPDTSRALLALEEAIRRLEARPEIITGNGSPEGVVHASIGAVYVRRDGGAATVLYVKEAGSDAAGWAAK